MDPLLTCTRPLLQDSLHFSAVQRSWSSSLFPSVTANSIKPRSSFRALCKRERWFTSFSSVMIAEDELRLASSPCESFIVRVPSLTLSQICQQLTICSRSCPETRQMVAIRFPCKQESTIPPPRVSLKLKFRVSLYSPISYSEFVS